MLPSATFCGNFSRIAAATESMDSMPDTAAKPPSSAALGSGRPMWRRAMSVAATVQRRAGLKSFTKSPMPSVSKLWVGVDENITARDNPAEDIT